MRAKIIEALNRLQGEGEQLVRLLQNEGYVVVPIEPDDTMLSSGCRAGLSTTTLLNDTRFACERATWAAMLKESQK